MKDESIELEVVKLQIYELLEKCTNDDLLNLIYKLFVHES